MPVQTAGPNCCRESTIVGFKSKRLCHNVRHKAISAGTTTRLLQAISLSFGEKSTIIHVARQVLRVNDSGGLTMKVVAGSLGNDAIGPLDFGRRRSYGLAGRVGSSRRPDRFISIVTFWCHKVGCASSKVRRGIRPFGALSA